MSDDRSLKQQVDDLLRLALGAHGAERTRLLGKAVYWHEKSIADAKPTRANQVRNGRS